MAKKIIIYERDRASEVLEHAKIEHVSVKQGNGVFLVVLNKDIVSAKDALKESHVVIQRIKTVRHYENYALKYTHYQPTFDCKCRHCGKTFSHPVKDAVWCSKECYKAFRNERREAKKKQKDGV